MSKQKLPAISERDFQAQVLSLAKLHGWTAVHFRPARTSNGWRTPIQGDGKGFPDLILCRGPHLLFVELKTDRGKPTAEQTAWLNRLRAAGQTACVWRPRDWLLIERILREEP